MTFALETERLHLRQLTIDDAAGLAAILGDEETMRWFPHPLLASEINVWIEKQCGRYASGTGLLALVHKGTGELIGDCGPVWQEVDGKVELEIGYHVRRDHWGQGYAGEAARTVMQYGFGNLGVNTIISLIRPENLASRRVAEKNGLTMRKVTFWRNYEHCIYQIEKEC